MKHETQTQRTIFLFFVLSFLAKGKLFTIHQILLWPVTKYRCVFNLHLDFFHIYEALRKLTIENVFGNDVNTDRVQEDIK